MCRIWGLDSRDYVSGLVCMRVWNIFMFRVHVCVLGCVHVCVCYVSDRTRILPQSLLVCDQTVQSYKSGALDISLMSTDSNTIVPQHLESTGAVNISHSCLLICRITIEKEKKSRDKEAKSRKGQTALLTLFL